LEDLGTKNVVIYSGHLEYFTTIRYILWALGNIVRSYVFHIFFPTLVYRTKKNLATLLLICAERRDPPSESELVRSENLFFPNRDKKVFPVLGAYYVLCQNRHMYCNLQNVDIINAPH
jgi:hypothetical protein